MPGGQAPPAGAASAVLLGYARLDDATVSRSLFPACLHTCKHSLHNTKGQRIRARGTGPALLRRRAQMRAHMSEKPARVVGDSDPRIVVYTQHPIALPSHAMHYPRGGERQC
jgi:hypothetical protein